MTNSNNYIEWRQFPFIRLAPGLTIGILTSRFLLPTDAFHWILSIGLFSVIALQFRKQFLLFHVGLHALLILSGISLVQNRSIMESINDISYKGIATICEAPIEKPKTFKTILLIDGFQGSSKPIKSIAYLKKSEAASFIRPGDRLLVDVHLRVLDPPELPGLFDYRKFLSNQRIGYTCYIRPDDWEQLDGVDFRMALKRRTSYLKHKLTVHFDRSVPEPTSALIKAMFLGEKSHIESETRESFAKAGIVHILAVSGLHVGIIYMVISLLFRPFSKLGSKWKAGTILMEVLCIWGFALLTGSGPSVQRAAFMFSLFSVAKQARMDTHAVNITAASAIMLLVIDPNMLFKAGFQLSYTAVFGILLTHPVMYPKLIFHNRFLDWIWQMQVVSFGAVAGTAPISIFLFHQFPLAFPIANLIAIPAAFVLVCGAVLLTAMMFLPGLANLTGIGLNHLGVLLIQLTETLAGFRYSHISPIYISRLEAVLMYSFMMLTLLMFIRWQSRHFSRWLATILVILTIGFLTRSFIKYRHVAQYETYEPVNGFHYNIGDKQYQFVTEETLEDPYRKDLGGHYKFDRINKSETFYLKKDMIEEIRDCLR